MAVFDPYETWLNIPPEERPISYYRLLDIPDLESDADTIKAALEHRSAYLQIFQAGAHAEIAQQLIGKITAAAACLLHAEKKAEYDARLRASRGEVPNQPASAPPVIQPVTPATNTVPAAIRSPQPPIQTNPAADPAVPGAIGKYPTYPAAASASQVPAGSPPGVAGVENVPA